MKLIIIIIIELKSTITGKVERKYRQGAQFPMPVARENALLPLATFLSIENYLFRETLFENCLQIIIEQDASQGLLQQKISTGMVLFSNQLR